MLTLEDGIYQTETNYLRDGARGSVLSLKVARATEQFFRQGIINPSKAPYRTLQIICPVATRKTSCALHFGENFEKEAKKNGVDLQQVHVNLKLSAIIEEDMMERWKFSGTPVPINR